MISTLPKNLLRTALLWCSFSLTGFASESTPDLKTVAFVDVGQYLGKWYEIGKLPQPFQTGCTGVTAEYSLNEDGSVKVFNSCRLFDPTNGQLITITGRAVPVDETNSKLLVSFSDALPKGNYWVLELADDYSYALVGEPSRNSLFVLSRTPQMADELYQELLDKAVSKHGYDVSKVEKTPQ